MLTAFLLAQTAGGAALGAPQDVIYPPIPPGPATVLPDFIGSPAKAQPLADAGVPQDPFLGTDPFSYVHGDSWNSDTSRASAPLGHNLQSYSSTLGMPDVLHLVASQAVVEFDRHGRLVVNFIANTGMSMFLIDPSSLRVLASYPMTNMGSGTESLGSAYFFIDSQDRIVASDGPHDIITLRAGGSVADPTLELVPDRSYDLTSVVPEGDRLAGILPDWHGRIWFQTAGKAADGPRVGVIDPETWPEIKWAQLDPGEQISNGMAVTRTGTFVLTSKALYKLEAGQDGQPHRLWAATYDTSDTVKPGQLSLGSGTSPTVFGGGRYVAINDSATPMKVVVFRTATDLKPGETRRVGTVPVFENMAGQACANSLLGYRNSIVVENNYGYTPYFDADGNGASLPNLPGFERIDVSADGQSLHKVWVNHEVASNTVPRLSTRTGLIYVMARQQDDITGADVYYWTALDFRTGKAVWQKMAGRGFNWDSYWGTTALGPNGSMYVGNYGGLSALRDGK